jgi:hypothetical protein
MRHIYFAATALAAALVIVACQTNDDGSSCATTTGDGGGPDSDAGDADASDPACQAQPVALPDHPSAASQASSMGRSLRNVRGFHGRVYFGYGDLNANTGPVDIASFDPVTKQWAQHMTLQTHSIERFITVGDELWAPCGQPMDILGTGCEFASGDADHNWETHDFAKAIHVMDGVERVPGEVLLGGNQFLDAGMMTAGATIWRSLGGGPFEEIFPGGSGLVQSSGAPFMSMATLNSVTFAVTDRSVWAWDGAVWAHARVPGNPDDPILLSDFTHPVTIANHIVFGTFGGYLWKFDGKHTERLGIRTFETPTAAGFTEAPLLIMEESEGRLLVVNENGEVLMSTDLVNFRCIGKAPADVRGLGSLNGVVYFGGADGHVYAYDHASW